jgi:hypothetical protein
VLVRPPPATTSLSTQLLAQSFTRPHLSHNSLSSPPQNKQAQVTSMGDGNDKELFDRCWSMPRTSSPPPSPILVPATLNPPPHLALLSFSKTTSPTKSVDSDNPWTMTPTTSGVVHPSLIIFLPAESMGAVTSSVVNAKLLNNDGGADLPKLLLVRLHEECVQSYLLVFLLPVLASSYMRVEIGRGGTS